MCQDSNSAVIAQAQTKDDPIDILDELIEIGRREFDDPGIELNLRLNIQWWAEATRNDDLRDSVKQSAMDVWADALSEIVTRGQTEGRFSPDNDATASGRVLLSMWLGLLLQRAINPDVDIDGYLSVVKAMYSGQFAIDGHVATQS